MVGDHDRKMQNARAPAAMVLAQLSWNMQVTASERFVLLQGNILQYDKESMHIFLLSVLCNFMKAFC